MTILFHEYELMAASGLFDPHYYVHANPDVAELNVDPLLHYLEHGGREGRNPSADFDTPHYLSQCLEWGEKPDNALLHYLTVGVTRGLAVKIGEKSAKFAAGKPAIRQEMKLNSRSGGIDVFGHAGTAGGWLYVGWLPGPVIVQQQEPVEVVSHYERSRTQGTAIVAFFSIDGAASKGNGFIAFVPGDRKVVGRLRYIALTLREATYEAHVADASVFLTDEEVLDRVRTTLANEVSVGGDLDALRTVVFKRRFTGQDTLSSLSQPVLMEIDEAILCPPRGVLFKGWIISARGAIQSIRVRSGALVADEFIANSILISRPDVVAAVGYQFDMADDRCGFVSYVPNAVSRGQATYLEIELENGETGFKPFKMSKRSGLDAIRRILEDVQVPYGAIDSAYDKVLGPAISSLNTARLKEAPALTEIKFGPVQKRPLCSLVIPLYGRVDFLEYQMALFSRRHGPKPLEIIYVLDDPSKRRELELLAKSAYERFRLPFRLLMLSANLGFAPASNVGLEAANGEFVCFLNSDVFPITEDWVERLVDRLKKNSRIGVIGARLLFEDGSIQHEGCEYLTIPEFGNWSFVDHLNKGRRPQAGVTVRDCQAITGACMLMKRSLATSLGGFDVAFIIGDFEDSDLCRRISARGLKCSVDNEVQLYHLERKSQTGPNRHWRMNLTLYNAWIHQRRWFNSQPHASSTFAS